MQVVIDIPKEMYEEIIDESGIDTMLIPFRDIIKNGTSLPKGHGRLIDADELYSDFIDGTEYGVYDACDTDLEFYNFLGGTECYDKDDIKEKMHEISGADDAYYNALEQVEMM